MREAWKTSNWYTCSSWNKKIWRKPVQGYTTRCFHFFLPSFVRLREHCLRDTVEGGGHEWQLVLNQKQNEGTWSAMLYVGYCILVGWRMQNKVQVSKTQFKKQLLNSITGWVSLKSIFITRHEWKISRLGNGAHHLPPSLWFKLVKNSN